MNNTEMRLNFKNFVAEVKNQLDIVESELESTEEEAEVAYYEEQHEQLSHDYETLRTVTHYLDVAVEVETTYDAIMETKKVKEYQELGQDVAGIVSDMQRQIHNATAKS